MSINCMFGTNAEKVHVPQPEWRTFPMRDGLDGPAWALCDGKRILDVAVESLQDGCLVSAPPAVERLLFLAASVYAQV